MEATKENSTMTWLITGSEGQLGKEMQLALRQSGITFVALNSRELDISNEVAVEGVVGKYKPTVILNAAAWTDVDAAEINEVRTFDINANGPKYLAKSAKNYESILVQISTDYVFSGVSDTPWLEDSEVNPTSVYGRSKSEGERNVLDYYKERSYIIRTAWLYSVHGNNFVKTMTKLAVNSQDLVKVVDDQIGQPTFAKDLAMQIVNIVAANAPVGIYHVTNSGQASWFELARDIFDLSGAKVSRLIPVNSSEYVRLAERPQYSVLSHEKWKDSGFSTMRHWREALDEAMPYVINQIERVE